MRIAILFELEGPQSGGAYSFNKMIFDSIIENRTNFAHELLTVYNRDTDAGISPDIFLPSSFQYRKSYLKCLLNQMFKGNLLRKRIDLEICRSASLNSLLLKNKIDVVWAVQPLGVPLNRPYVTTSWDILHKISPYFPEISQNGVELKRREKVSLSVFQRAYRIIVGTKTGREQLSIAYGINPERVLVCPFPTVFQPQTTIFPEGEYRILYPANFWPHKNHVALIKALKILVARSDLRLKLILTGADKGSLNALKSLVEKLSLQDYVEFPGFVSKGELHRLYASSSLLVFPSLVGPDNLPPIEALAFGCKVAVSDIPGAKEQFEKFSAYFDPYNIDEIADVIQSSLENHVEDFTKEELAIFLSERSPSQYINSVICELDKIRHLVEFI
jgi:glycosyltransferase involved in cell wall biosynthesis